ncbi:ATP-dependent helicase BRM [Platanthera guangdongensis]|uniref:ATP-dependent helicase BRM n=1 Tax=Platanthera guangdongensis TaxID=2320717 RepID=A0ABR2MA80_9ASPA
MLGTRKVSRFLWGEEENSAVQAGSRFGTMGVMTLIAYLMEFKGNYGPHLIIAPNAILLNWKVVSAMKFNVLVSTYEFVMYDWSKLSRIDWKYIFFDEAQCMKDRESILARDLHGYHCQRRLLLTGTPLQIRPDLSRPGPDCAGASPASSTPPNSSPFIPPRGSTFPLARSRLNTTRKSIQASEISDLRIFPATRILIQHFVLVYVDFIVDGLIYVVHVVDLVIDGIIARCIRL